MKMFEKKDTYKPKDNDFIKNDILVLKERFLGDKFQDPKYQLFLADGSGFGCKSGNLGNAIFGEFLVDGERSRVERYDILGVLSYKAYEEFCQEVECLEKLKNYVVYMCDKENPNKKVKLYHYLSLERAEEKFGEIDQEKYYIDITEEGKILRTSKGGK